MNELSDNRSLDADEGKPNRIAQIALLTLIIAVTVPTLTYLALNFMEGLQRSAASSSGPIYTSAVDEIRGAETADQIYMGGFNGDALLLLIDEKRYVQSDQKIPLAEHPIKRMA